MANGLLLLSLAGLVALPASAPESIFIRVAGIPTPIKGLRIEGVDYAPVQALAESLGALAQPERAATGEATIVITAGAKTVKTFDESPDVTILVQDQDQEWRIVPNSRGHLRMRDFVYVKNSWNTVGELEVAPESMLIAGREPRWPMKLTFYVTVMDKLGKTIGRSLASVNNVSFDGGRYPFEISLSYPGPDQTLPASFTVRFQSAAEIVPQGS